MYFEYLEQVHRTQKKRGSVFNKNFYNKNLITCGIF